MMNNGSCRFYGIKCLQPERIHIPWRLLRIKSGILPHAERADFSRSHLLTVEGDESKCYLSESPHFGVCHSRKHNEKAVKLFFQPQFMFSLKYIH